MRILNCEPTNYNPEAATILQTLGVFEERELSRQELIDRISEYDVLIVRLSHQIDRQVLLAAKNLKVIVTATTGLDHIDLDEANNRGITVLSLRGETAFLHTIPATAEHTWALILALVRRIPWAYQSVGNGEWERDMFRGHDLAGQRLGILGLGRIGRMVAVYGKAFGMLVHAWDPMQVAWVDGVEKKNHMEDLLRIANILTVHAPLNETSQGMLAERELEHLPAGAFLINTARGDLVDSKALIAALRTGRLAGAALDVIPGERDPQNPDRRALIEYARSHDNLLITPHIGGATVESMAMTEVFMAKKLEAWAMEQC